LGGLGYKLGGLKKIALRTNLIQAPPLSKNDLYPWGYYKPLGCPVSLSPLNSAYTDNISVMLLLFCLYIIVGLLGSCIGCKKIFKLIQSQLLYDFFSGQLGQNM